LVHGDFWPGNIMISKSDTRDLRLLDWEMVGLGSGPQELGQYILSNMDPSERRECEDKLIRNYHRELEQLGVELSWEDCWKEYLIGGLERWLWFLVYFCSREGPLLKWAQFFHDQIKEFVHDHNIQPENVTQPRP
jgi:aminoglycoside phosphotransferase (APT) family kinase protein